ncbi:DUF4230 domain-containing protein [Tenacibaculum sp. UWU-22]|uniref:DUF4230 domain-containing protein n=1 Tax=Tenacibaculum sp. UWU-22 TaxID=3234187 RepID=UPI0034DAFF2D
MQFIKYIAIFLLGFLVAKFWYQKTIPNYTKEDTQVIVNEIKNIRKLVVSTGSFSEMYNYSDSKKYFYDFLSFDKKAIVVVNAKVEVGYDLSKMDIQIDSVAKKIIINKIPEEEITVSPNIKYFDIQQSQFNTFSKEELNKINKKSIEKIKETMNMKALKKEAKTQLFKELSKIYQLSSVFGWQVVNNTPIQAVKTTSEIKN